MIFRLSRNYYRCAYRERKCLATKTIEQQEQNNAGTSSSAIAGVENAKYTVVYYGDHTCKDHNISMVQAPQQQPVNMDLQNGEMAQATANVQEPETDLDLPALLEVFDNSLSLIGMTGRCDISGLCTMSCRFTNFGYYTDSVVCKLVNQYIPSNIWTVNEIGRF